MTWGEAVAFTRVYGFLDHYQLADVAIPPLVWQKRNGSRNLKLSPYTVLHALSYI